MRRFLYDKGDAIKSNIHFPCEIVKAFLNLIWPLFNLFDAIGARRLEAVYRQTSQKAS